MREGGRAREGGGRREGREGRREGSQISTCT